MTTNSSPEMLDARQIRDRTQLFQINNQSHVPISALRMLLPDIETALFFAKLYDLDYNKVSELVYLLFRTDVIEALLGEGHTHSTELQDYIVDIVPSHITAEHGSGTYDASLSTPDAALLKAVFESINIQVAQSIKDVADKLGSVLGAMTSKYGAMTFKHLHKFNAQRNAIGTFQPVIEHKKMGARLVVLDVSGSMTHETVTRIVEPIVDLAYEIDASMATVSNSAYLWNAGSFTAADVLARAEFSGTHYEQLAPIFNRDWETVITIADYDSAAAAQDYLVHNATGRVGQVLDISLVNRVTYLAECVGRIASDLKPLLIGKDHYVLQ